MISNDNLVDINSNPNTIHNVHRDVNIDLKNYENSSDDDHTLNILNIPQTDNVINDLKLKKDIYHLDISGIDLVNLSIANLSTDDYKVNYNLLNEHLADNWNQETFDLNLLASNSWQIGFDLSTELSLQNNLSSSSLTSMSTDSSSDSFEFSNHLLTESQSLPNFQMDCLTSFSNINLTSQPRRVSMQYDNLNFVGLNLDDSKTNSIQNNTEENSLFGVEAYLGQNITYITEATFLSKDKKSPFNLSDEQKKKLKPKKSIKKYILLPSCDS
eukprot:Awhi_evm3s8829